MGKITEKNSENGDIKNLSNNTIKGVTTPLGDSIAETIQSKFSIREDIDTPEAIEKIRDAFLFYKNEVLPLILDNPKVTQQKEGYHGLYTHTENVVFRGICYAVSLGEDPIPVVFACACHDLARVHNGYDENHGPNAVPVTTEIINNKKFNLTEEQKEQIIDAVRNHTTGKGGEAPNYISACLRDADRTRLSRDREYIESCYNTEIGKIIGSGSRENFTKFQNLCINIEGKDPGTITPEEFNLILMDRNDIKYLDEYLKERHTFSQLSPEMISLYDKIINLQRIQELPEETRKSFLKRLFSNIAQHCDVDACMEIIPSLINEGYDLDIIERLSIRENNKTIIKLILDDKEIVELLNKKIEKNKNTYRTIPDEMETISRIVTIDNFKYLKNCLKLNVGITWLPYFREDTNDIIQKYLSGYEYDSWKMGDILDRIHRRGHTFQSIKNIFGDEQITPLTGRLLEFKDFDKFKNVGINEYKNLSIEDKKLFLNGFISALTPSDIKYPNRGDEDFKNLQGKMKIFSELDWPENTLIINYKNEKLNLFKCRQAEVKEKGLTERSKELVEREKNYDNLIEAEEKKNMVKRINGYYNLLRVLLSGIPDNERVAPTYKGPSNIHYRKEYRERNKIPPLVDDLEKVLNIRTETIKGRTMKVAEVDLKTDLGIYTHTFVSILAIEALEITDSQMFLSVGNNGCGKNEIPTFTRKGGYYNLLLKPRKIDDMYVQASCDIDSGNGAMKNLYNFEHIMLPSVGNHWECISLVPTAIKKELNLSQEDYTKRINALGNVTTLQEVGEKDKELELAIRRALNKISIYEGLVTPTVMGISIGKMDLNDVDEDILDYCARRDIPIVKIKYPEGNE